MRRQAGLPDRGRPTLAVGARCPRRAEPCLQITEHPPPRAFPSSLPLASSCTAAPLLFMNRPQEMFAPAFPLAVKRT